MSPTHSHPTASQTAAMVRVFASNLSPLYPARPPHAIAAQAAAMVRVFASNLSSVAEHIKLTVFGGGEPADGAHEAESLLKIKSVGTIGR
eukprot:366547-Chlamydomonas_euryale.AAC.11